MNKKYRHFLQSFFYLTVLLWFCWTFFRKQPRRIYSNEEYVECMVQIHQAFQTLNVSWFIGFGTALSYHRDNTFQASDIDTGIFYDDLFPVADRVGPTFSQHGFIIISTFGTLDHGQQWQFRCPLFDITMDIFVFYPPLPSDPKSSSFQWWAATYLESCDLKRYQKCRWKFSSFINEKIFVKNISFQIVPTSFLLDQYGSDWRIHKHFTYAESIKILPNLIDE